MRGKSIEENIVKEIYNLNKCLFLCGKPGIGKDHIINNTINNIKNDNRNGTTIEFIEIDNIKELENHMVCSTTNSLNLFDCMNFDSNNVRSLKILFIRDIDSLSSEYPKIITSINNYIKYANKKKSKVKSNINSNQGTKLIITGNCSDQCKFNIIRKYSVVVEFEGHDNEKIVEILCEYISNLRIKKRNNIEWNAKFDNDICNSIIEFSNKDIRRGIYMIELVNSDIKREKMNRNAFNTTRNKIHNPKKWILGV